MKPVKPIGPDKRKQLDASYNEAEFVAYDATRGIGIYKIDEDYYVYQHDTLRKKGDVRSVREFLEKKFVDVKPAPINNMQESYTFMDYLSSLGLAPDEDQFNKQQEYKEKTYQKGCYTWSEYFAENKKGKQVGVLYNQDRKREISTNGENVEKGVELKESAKLLAEATTLNELSSDSTLEEVLAAIDACKDPLELLNFAVSSGLWYEVDMGLLDLGQDIQNQMEDEFSGVISVATVKDWAAWLENIDAAEGIDPDGWYYTPSLDSPLKRPPYIKLEKNDTKILEIIKGLLKDFIEDQRAQGEVTLSDIEG